MQNKQKPDLEEMQKIMHSMQVGMCNLALNHIENIGIRTLRVLQKLALYEDVEERFGDDLDPEVLKDPDHSLRDPLPSGPLVLYRTDGEPPERHIREYPTLLFADRREVREAALVALEPMVADPLLLITPRTRTVLRKVREDLLSEDPAKWMQASVKGSDALNDDILIALAGTEQSLACKRVIQESLDTYSQQVLYPSISSLESIQLAAGKGERERDLLESLVEETVTRSDTLKSLCNHYLQALGFLPLAKPYSFSTVLERWLNDHEMENEELWKQLWEWADQAQTPLAVYHVCTVFILRPDLIPEGQLEKLWEKILFVVDQKSLDESSNEESSHAPWLLRRDLAKHYTYHLESQLPDNDGAVIGALAWWLAERVAGTLSSDPKSAHFYHKEWIRRAEGISQIVWLAASAPVQTSFLRYITLTSSSPWAMALLVLMGESLEGLKPEDLKHERKDRFQEALVSNILTSLPLSLETPETPTFAQECSMRETVLKWAENQDKENNEALEQILRLSQELGSSEGLCKALRKLDENNVVNQAAICLALKGKVLMNPAVGKDLWEILSDAEWRKDVLATRESGVQGILIECFSILMVANQEEWISQLPHYLAELCENAEDEESRRNLFFYVLYLSMASDTVSAVHRLLKGEQRAKLAGFVDEYRKHAEQVSGNYPPWVAGKLRALMASLYVV